ncbi:hypothetical protein BD779DRAFT_1487505 [Infundibulicybe gibba]|nr:hypothetical protein BD779DRAFT_1487505 [Infundibulicybe gibba]
MVYIPFELIGLIIEQMADSPSALRACALVCKAWVPDVFRVLFREFTLKFDFTLPLHARPFEDIHAGLRFPRYVLRLTMWIKGGPPAEFKNAESPPFSFFNNARKIVLIISDHHDFIYHLHSTHTQLRELYLASIFFPNTHGLQTLVAGFPNLERLGVSLMGQPHPAHTDAHLGDLRPPLRLRTLMYDNSADACRISFLHWLSIHPPTLEHLTLTGLCSDLQSTDALLCTLGPRLHTLGVSFDTHVTLTYPLLRTNTQLYILRISLPPYDPLQPSLHIPLALLASSSPSLASFDDQDWGALDATLARRAPSLECFHVVMNTLGVLDIHELHRQAKKRMPYCSEKGIFAGVESMSGQNEYFCTRIPKHGRLRHISTL